MAGVYRVQPLGCIRVIAVNPGIPYKFSNCPQSSEDALLFWQSRVIVSLGRGSRQEGSISSVVWREIGLQSYRIVSQSGE